MNKKLLYEKIAMHGIKPVLHCYKAQAAGPIPYSNMATIGLVTLC